MPRTEIYFYMERDGTVPVLDWLKELRRQEQRGYAKCLVRIERLAEEGHALRRPEAEADPKTHLYEDPNGEEGT